MLIKMISLIRPRIPYSTTRTVSMSVGALWRVVIIYCWAFLKYSLHPLLLVVPRTQHLAQEFLKCSSTNSHPSISNPAVINYKNDVSQEHNLHSMDPKYLYPTLCPEEQFTLCVLQMHFLWFLKNRRHHNLWIFNIGDLVAVIMFLYLETVLEAGGCCAACFADDR